MQTLSCGPIFPLPRMSPGVTKQTQNCHPEAPMRLPGRGKKPKFLLAQEASVLETAVRIGPKEHPQIHGGRAALKLEGIGAQRGPASPQGVRATNG